MAAAEVRAQIEAAFAATPHPGRAFAAISATLDDEGIVAYFGATTWRGHHVRELRRHVAALSFFTDAAFRYWLPAFMLADLDSPREADVIAEHIAGSLAAAASPGADRGRARAEARIGAFAAVELEAVLAFLDDCRGRGDSGQPLRNAVKAVRARLAALA